MTPLTSFEGSRGTAGADTSCSAVAVMRSGWHCLKQARSRPRKLKLTNYSRKSSCSGAYNNIAQRLGVFKNTHRIYSRSQRCGQQREPHVIVAVRLRRALAEAVAQQRDAPPRAAHTADSLRALEQAKRAPPACSRQRAALVGRPQASRCKQRNKANANALAAPPGPVARQRLLLARGPALERASACRGVA